MYDTIFIVNTKEKGCSQQMIEICTDIITEDGKDFEVYGIKTDSRRYDALCTDRQRVEEFIQKVIKYDGFSLLDDLIEDFLV